jgi:glycine/D-amino acid oxidase-like deaminating enzyme
MSQWPSSAHAVGVGAGILGLSTGWHLALERARRGTKRAASRFATRERHW